MARYSSLKDTLWIPIHPKGRMVIAAAFAIAIILYLVSETLGCLALAVAVFTYYFYRNPDRMVPQGEGLVLASGDGEILSIQDASLPAELNLSTDVAYRRISIYMSLFHVHVNRTPVAGELIREVLIPGKFINSSKPDASEQNERSIAAIRTDKGEIIAFSQIAGMVSRTVVCEVYEGDRLEQGQRYGIIRFGCRADVYVPKHYTLMVAEGSSVKAGETILAVDNLVFKPELLSWQKK